MGRVLRTLPGGDDVCGVTSLDNVLYVLRSKSSQQIAVYDMDSYCLQRRINVSKLGFMADMTACAYSHCLYISGGTDKCVHRVALSDDDVTQWPVNDVAGFLSITNTHTVLVTCRDVRKIKEFTTHGELLRQIELSQDVVSPRHAIQLSRGEFIVCHGARGDPASLHRVCLLGSDGQVIKSYGGPRGSGSEQMNVPLHMAVDGNGFVFVLDHNNHRVLLLCSALTYIREVVSSEQLKWDPLRLFLDDDRRRLYVADNKWDGEKWTAGRVVVIGV